MARPPLSYFTIRSKKWVGVQNKSYVLVTKVAGTAVSDSSCSTPTLDADSWFLD
jgi:hypothetical protein